MLEALIDIATGDVLVVKPVGSIWGKDEVNRVIALQDDELEQKIGPDGFIVWPYMAIEIAPRRRANGTVITRGGKPVTYAKSFQRSLVKVEVNEDEIKDVRVEKSGILRAKDADTPLAIANIIEVKPVPVKTDPAGIIDAPAAVDLPPTGKPDVLPEPPTKLVAELIGAK